MKGLRFKQYYGSVKFFYTEPSRGGGQYEVHETVPESIAKQGEEAILSYAQRKVNEAKRGWRNHEIVEDSIRKNNIPIQTQYDDGTPLEGRIVEATSRYIGVELDKPLKGQSSINLGFASAMSGHFVFTDDSQISQAGYNAAYRALRWAYGSALNTPTTDLVGLLNQTTKRG